MKPVTHDNWPYPTWVAHRGAGKLVPENTLAAFRYGAQQGYRMFECDVKLSADDVPFLMHDDTLERTTSGRGTGGDLSWRELAQLDAGNWHSRLYAGEPLPSFENIAHFCLRNDRFLNIEIKPTPGTERHTGEVVARHAARLWHKAAVPPLLTSFKVEALEGAQAAEPDLPRGLLVHELWKGWLEKAQQLQCVALVFNHSLWDEEKVQLAKSKGFRALSYTVNDEWEAERLINLGTDGIITDRVDFFSPTHESGFGELA